MIKEKACKNCKRIYEGDLCPVCNKKDTTDAFKGKVEIIVLDDGSKDNSIKVISKYSKK